MRGEDGVRGQRRPLHGGSPPHARGRPGRRRFPARSRRITPACAGKTGRSRLTCSNRLRITPACAGKTSTSISGKPVTGDHPRMRGED